MLLLRDALLPPSLGKLLLKPDKAASAVGQPADEDSAN
jgi:hypothetical protein